MGSTESDAMQFFLQFRAKYQNAQRVFGFYFVFNLRHTYGNEFPKHLKNLIES